MSQPLFIYRMKLKLLVIVIILLGTFSCEKKPVHVRPNIVLIHVDDLGWKDVGFMGSGFYQTPHIDALSAQGMVFSNAYASASNCAPSRASLMTGRWTTRHGVYTVGTSERGKTKNRKLIPVANNTTLSENQKVISKVLQENGYTTCHSGKWHLSDDPLKFGFDLNIGGGHNGHPKSYSPPYKNVQIAKGESSHLTDLVMEHTLKFIDTVKGSFFLNYAPYAVHTPIQSVDSLVSKYEGKSDSSGQNNVAYATMIDNLDRNIGLLIAKLKQQNLFDNTMIVFTSDNGGLFGITRQHPLRAGKGSYYEGGIRTPFFFVWKNRIQAGSKTEVPMTNLDIFPTFLHVAEIDQSRFALDGVDLIAVLENQEDGMMRPLFWHFPIYLEAYNQTNNENRDALFRTRPGSVIRYGDWKLHYYFENNEVELFNLKKDIGETTDLALSEPEKTKELLTLLQAWWKETDAPLPKSRNPFFEK